MDSSYEEQLLNASSSTTRWGSGKTLRFVIPQDLGDVVVIDNPGDAYVRESLKRILT